MSVINYHNVKNFAFKSYELLTEDTYYYLSELLSETEFLQAYEDACKDFVYLAKIEDLPIFITLYHDYLCGDIDVETELSNRIKKSPSEFIAAVNHQYHETFDYDEITVKELKEKARIAKQLLKYVPGKDEIKVCKNVDDLKKSLTSSCVVTRLKTMVLMYHLKAIEVI